MSREIGLAALQRFLLEVIHHPDGIDAGLAAHPEIDLDEVLLPRPGFDPRDGLAVYRRSHEARLFAVLSGTYPRLRELVGATTFTELARAYAAAEFRPGSDLDDFGPGFPDWLQKNAPRFDLRSEAIELARLELALAGAARVSQPGKRPH